MSEHSPADPPSLSLRLATLSFAILVVTEMVGTRPFQISDRPTHAVEAGGSIFEFLIYLVSTGVCIWTCAVNLRPKRLNTAVVWMTILILYCGVTLLWSEAVFRGMIRYGQFVLVSVSVILASYTLGPRKIVTICYWTMVGLLLANFLSVFLIDGAVHGPSQYDPYQQLLGAWKGVHNHKNHAGAVAALTCLLAFCHIASGRWRHILVMIPAGIVLIGSNSKTSLAVLLFVIVLLSLCKSLHLLFGSFLSKYIVVFSLLLLTAIGALFADGAMAILEDPYALTGRVEVWNALARYVDAYPWTGSGFGSFWRLGADSPILRLTDGWGTITGNGHNGYLDTAVMIGIPGLALAMIVLVILPIAALIQRLQAQSFLYDAFFCMILFGLLHNLLESTLLVGNSAVYFTLLVGIIGISSGFVAGNWFERGSVVS